MTAEGSQTRIARVLDNPVAALVYTLAAAASVPVTLVFGYPEWISTVLLVSPVVWIVLGMPGWLPAGVGGRVR